MARAPKSKTLRRDRFGRFIARGASPRKEAPARDERGRFLPREAYEAEEAARLHEEEIATWTKDRMGRWHDERGRIVPAEDVPDWIEPAPEAPPPPSPEPEPEVQPEAPSEPTEPPEPEPPPTRPVRAEMAVGAALERLAEDLGGIAGVPWETDATRGGYPRVHTTGTTKYPGAGVPHDDAATALLRWWRSVPEDHPLRQMEAFQLNAHYADDHGRSGEWATGLTADPETAIYNAASALRDAGERYKGGQTVSFVFYTVDLGRYSIVDLG